MKLPFLTKRKDTTAPAESMELVLRKLDKVLAESAARPVVVVPRCLILDVSSSMGGECEPGVSKIQALRKLVAKLPEAPTYAFATEVWKVTATRIPDSDGSTNLAEAFERIKWDRHQTAVLITDGEPDDEEKALKAARGLQLEIFYSRAAPEAGVSGPAGGNHRWRGTGRGSGRQRPAGARNEDSGVTRLTGSATNPQVSALVQKLLALAANNPNRQEAAAAYCKAQELMQKHGLRIDVVGDGPAPQAAPPPPPNPPRPQWTPSRPQPSAAPPPSPSSPSSGRHFQCYSPLFCLWCYFIVFFLVLLLGSVNNWQLLNQTWGILIAAFVWLVVGPGLTGWFAGIRRDRKWIRPVVWGLSMLDLAIAVVAWTPADWWQTRDGIVFWGWLDVALILTCLIRPRPRFGWFSLKRYVIGVSVALVICLFVVRNDHGRGNPSPAVAESTKAETSLVRMRAPNGEIGEVPAGQVDHYKKLGATVVGQN
jgi:hypothetical protein